MGGSGKSSRTSSLPDTSGLRLHPLDEYSASPEPLTAIGGQGMEHSLAGIKGTLWLGLGGKEQSKVVGDEWKRGWGERAGKCIQTDHCQKLQFQLKCTKKFGGRAQPGPAGGA